MSWVDFTLSTSITTKVYFVPGTQNIIANHLSHFQNQDALRLVPNLCIQNFQPPQDAMGPAKNDTLDRFVQAASVAALDHGTPHSRVFHPSGNGD